MIINSAGFLYKWVRYRYAFYCQFRHLIGTRKHLISFYGRYYGVQSPNANYVACYDTCMNKYWRFRESSFEY